MNGGIRDTTDFFGRRRNAGLTENDYDEDVSVKNLGSGQCFFRISNKRNTQNLSHNV